MTPDERNLINGLFDRLASAGNQAKDPEADQLIRSKVVENPAAPYLLAQSTLVMQQALANAQNRIGALEKQVADLSASAHGTQPGGGFLSGVASFFGGGQQQPQQQPKSVPPPLPTQPQQYSQPQPPPAYAYPPQQAPAGRGGGGFLQGALGTAAGVAGGALLFQGIENLLGHNPGPFAGSIAPSGGFFGGGTGPTETTEIVNNYYDQPDQTQSGSQTLDQGDPNQASYDPDPDPDPDPNVADDYVSDDSGDQGGDDNTYV